MFRMFNALPVLMRLCSAAVFEAKEQTVPVILDTDMHTDCDDVGALALLHAFADEGKARILGVVHSAPAPMGPACVDAINTWYGRGDIPVGTIDWPGYATDPRYAHYRHSAQLIEDAGSDYVPVVAAEFPCTHSADEPYEDGVRLYRRLLASAEDHSVVICAVGQLQALARLLDSSPDDVSPLTGEALVRSKVKLFVTMGKGDWPHGRDTFNWRCDMPSAERVLNHWPGPLAVMTHGDDILTGSRLVAQGDAQSPTRRAYDIYLKTEDKLRSSWDQCAVYYAVAGTGDLFHEMRGRQLRFDAGTGRHEWVVDETSKHIYLDQSASSERIAEIVEEYMCRPPKASIEQATR